MTENKNSWGKVADWYDSMLEQNSDTYQTQVILPNLLRVLALTPGEKLIDIACGQGFFTRAYKEAGASPIGADISKELIVFAKEHAPGIPFHVAPAHNLTFAKAHAFNAAVMVLALQNIENIDAALAEAKRVLAAKGRLILVLNHPVFRVPKHSSWEYDEKSKTQFRRIDRYLSSEKVLIDMHPGKKPRVRTITYHRSLQDITKSLRKNGFAIVRLEEWISHRNSERGPRQKAEDAARKEIPLFMMIEAVII
jgi:ubiquinone/menaquinone biosynthesis C-methylase UbiE